MYQRRMTKRLSELNRSVKFCKLQWPLLRNPIHFEGIVNDYRTFDLEAHPVGLRHRRLPAIQSSTRSHDAKHLRDTAAIECRAVSLGDSPVRATEKGRIVSKPIPEIDRIPRYVPDWTIALGFHGGMITVPVVSVRAFPPNTHPKNCPIVADMTAVEMVTARHGSRWWGFERAYINSELRMVVIGFSSRCEIRSRWEVVKVEV